MKKQILICDDEEGIRESLKLILEKDYDLSFAGSGEEAIEIAGSKPFDLVILDIKMPRMSGLDIMREMKKINPNLKVVIVTGYKSVETVQEAVRLGAVDYITKPFERGHILSVAKKNA